MTNVPHILSLGGGVQSSMIALGAAQGLFTPMPIAAIFADTQAEPASVYKWLEWLEKQLPFPVHRVTRGSLTDDTLELRVSKKSGQTYLRAMLPAYFERPNGGKGLLGRKCTAEYKVRVLLQKQRQLADVPRGCKDLKCVTWIGISTDEASRMKPSTEKWCKNRWPLIEAGMSREDCLIWMQDNGYPRPPRSACVYCPFHSDAEWLRLKNEEPEEFDRAVHMDRTLREMARQQTGTARLSGDTFLHSSLQPLNEVKFSTVPSHLQLDLFKNDCSGMCGV